MLVLVEVDDRVATVTLNRPEARNALSAELQRELDAAVTDLDGREDVGCMVLTGADPAFCAGVDLKSLSTERRVDQQDRMRNPAHALRHAGDAPDPGHRCDQRPDRDRRSGAGPVLRLPHRVRSGRASPTPTPASA